MKPGISFTKIWFDDDMVELRIKVSNGDSVFTNDVYVGHQQLMDLVKDMDRFKTHVHGERVKFTTMTSLVRLVLKVHASGAFFYARLHFQERGIVLRYCEKSQSEFADFGKKNAASEATLYLRTEPALLDNFIEELRQISGGKRRCAA